jgi:hypothetical protein
VIGDKEYVLGKRKFAPLSAQIRLETVCHLLEFNPNLWGERLGVRSRNDLRNAKAKPNRKLKGPALSAVHPLNPTKNH